MKYSYVKEGQTDTLFLFTLSVNVYFHMSILLHVYCLISYSHYDECMYEYIYCELSYAWHRRHLPGSKRLPADCVTTSSLYSLTDL